MVCTPAISNSASARRARSMACGRSRPVTISLASSESNCPPTTLPASTPESSRMPGPAGGRNPVIVPVEGANSRAGSSALIRNSIACRRGAARVPAGDGQRMAGRDQQLGPDQVDVGALLGHRVLDLQPGVDLQEGQLAPRREQELHGAGVDVAGLPADGLGRPFQDGPLGLGQERRGGLLDELLVAALQGAVAGPHHQDVTVHVRQDLRLDVPAALDVGLDEALAAAERGRGLAHGGVEQACHLAGLARDPQPAAAAAVRGLDRDRQPVLLGESTASAGSATGRFVPGSSGAPARAAMARAATLSPSARMTAGGGPIQARPASRTAWAKPAFSARKP